MGKKKNTDQARVELTHPEIVKHLEATRFQVSAATLRWAKEDDRLKAPYRDHLTFLEGRALLSLAALKGAAKFDEINDTIPFIEGLTGSDQEWLLRVALDKLVSEHRVGCAPIGAGSPLRYWVPLD